MQELRFVLIVVGVLAIAALLFHGLWTSKKEGKSKFGDKPLGKLDVEGDEIAERSAERTFSPEDDFDVIRKERKEPVLSAEPLLADPLVSDPLTEGYIDPIERHYSEPSAKAHDFDLRMGATSAQNPAPEAMVTDIDLQEELPKEDVRVTERAYSFEADLPSMSALDTTVVDIPVPKSASQKVDNQRVESQLVESSEPSPIVDEPEAVEPQPEPEMQVIVLNVHCTGENAFIGTKLFDSMEQNGLLYGEMDIFHRHADLSGTGKVLFSVANMMQPGTLKHDDPADFSTKGISFFMTLPCFGDGEQNFKLMLKAAQQIADDLGANVLDDARNLITPNRLDAYRAQIKQFKAAQHH